MTTNLIQRAYLVPGQPHVYLAPDRNPGWGALRQAYEAVGREIEQSGAELMLLYSTQWFSVIGHLFQVDPQPKWTLVDQNWYDLGEIPYEFRVDPEFGKLYCGIAKDRGMQAATVAYHGFPIDTGTVVALKLLNPNNRIPASVVSCNIYAEREETRALGFAARAAIERYGKKTIVVIVTNLSNRYEVAEIDPARDRISSQKDDEWNRKILEMLAEGRLEDVAQVAREFGREANADMGFKAIWWLGAVMGEHNKYDGKVWDYAPVWGTGSAVVQLTPNPNKQMAWEKEFDEAPVETAEQGTGLETHNVLADGPRVDQPSGMSSVGTNVSEAPARAGQSPRDDESRTDSATGNTTSRIPPVTPSVSEGPGREGQSGSEQSRSRESGSGGSRNRESGNDERANDQPLRADRPSGSLAPARDDSGVVRTDRAAKPVGPYPHARRVGDMLFLSGIGPRHPVTNEIPEGIEAQTRACVDNIRAILEEAGSSIEKILDVTVYLTDMKRDFDRFNKVYAEYFAHVQPTRTTVGVDSLPTPINVELKVIAAG